MASLGSLSKRKYSLTWIIASLLFTAVMVAILTRLVLQNIDVLMQARENLRLWPLFLTVVVFGIGEVLSSLAWGKLMNDVTRPLPYREHFKIFIVTHAGRRIPGSLWYVLGRVAWYEQLGVGRLLTSFASALETLVILGSGMISTTLLIFLLPGPAQKNLPYLLIGILLCLFLIHPRLIAFLVRRMGYPEQSEKLRYRHVLTWVGIYLPIWWIGGLILYLSINSIFPLPLNSLPICVGAWSLAGVLGMLVIILPTGFGLTEASLGLTLATIIPSSIAVVAAVLLRVVLTTLEFLFALIVFLSFRMDRKAKKSAE